MAELSGLPAYHVPSSRDLTISLNQNIFPFHIISKLKIPLKYSV